MTKFDYHKWVTENKYGKGKGYSYKPLNEIAVQDTHPDFGQGPCFVCATSSGDITFSSGNSGPFYASPNSPYTWKLIQVDDYSEGNDEGSCYSYEAGPLYWGNTNMNTAGSIYGTDNGCALTASNNTSDNEDGGDTGGLGYTEDSYLPFCCDINAVNFGQMADGQPYGTNPGEPEQYLMINGPQGDMCDNSICQGNVNQPDPEGMPFDDKAGADSGGDSDQQSQQADKAFQKTKGKFRKGDRRDPKGRNIRLNEYYRLVKKFENLKIK